MGRGIVTFKGALTGRVYQFNSRPWELKSVFSFELNSLEYTPIVLYIKNDTIVRVLPKTTGTWLTDYSRYFFKNFTSNKAFNFFAPIIYIEKGVSVVWNQILMFFLFLFRNARKVNLV